MPGLSSVSVIADQCLLAGTLSTIAMLKGKEGPAWCTSLGLQAVVMDEWEHGSVLNGTRYDQRISQGGREPAKRATYCLGEIRDSTDLIASILAH